jgi:hypothetical protein
MIMMRALMALTAVFVAGHVTAKPPEPSTPAVVVNVSVPSASAPSIGSLLVTVDGVDAKDMENRGLLSGIDDIKQAHGVGEVSFEKAIELAHGPAQRRWLLPFKVKNLPAGTTQTRYLSFKLGDADWALPYQIASPAAPAISWSLKPIPAGNRRLDAGNEGIPISIAVSAGANLTGVRLMAMDLVDLATRESLAKMEWRLCHSAADCKKEVSSLVGGAHPLWVVPANLGAIPPGKYEGMLTIASDDKPAGESINLTLNISPPYRQGLGFGAILAGIGLGFYVTTFLRRRVDRAQLLLGPALLRQALDRLSTTLHADGLANVPTIDQAIASLKRALSEETLENNGLPPRIPIPWPASLDGYRQYIARQQASFDSLQAIVNLGVLPLLAARHDDEARDGPLNGGEATAFQATMDRIDVLAAFGAQPPDAPTVLAAAKVAIDDFKTAIETSRGLPAERTTFTAGAAPSERIRPPQTPEQLRIRVTEGSLQAWFVLGILTALTGAQALILSNPGFGSCMDLLGCLLWGAGLPAGSALAASTAGTVSSALNITR